MDPTSTLYSQGQSTPWVTPEINTVVKLEIIINYGSVRGTDVNIPGIRLLGGPNADTDRHWPTSKIWRGNRLTRSHSVSPRKRGTVQGRRMSILNSLTLATSTTLCSHYEIRSTNFRTSGLISCELSAVTLISRTPAGVNIELIALANLKTKLRSLEFRLLLT